MTSADVPPSLTVLRTLLVLGVVLVMLATTGWTTIRQRPVSGLSMQAALASWARERIVDVPPPDPGTAPPRTVAAWFAAVGPARAEGRAPPPRPRRGEQNAGPPRPGRAAPPTTPTPPARRTAPPPP
ncbi:hypothetical protein ACFW1I_06460, partial [Streptomyces sp. NPDC058955]